MLSALRANYSASAFSFPPLYSSSIGKSFISYSKIDAKVRYFLLRASSVGEKKLLFLFFFAIRRREARCMTACAWYNS